MMIQGKERKIKNWKMNGTKRKTRYQNKKNKTNRLNTKLLRSS